MPNKKSRMLYRSERNRMIAGVCGGIGEYFGIDPVAVRLIFILFTLAGASSILVYLILWLIVPTEGKARASPRDAVRSGVAEMRSQARRIELAAGGRKMPWFGLSLILIGIGFLLNDLGFFARLGLTAARMFYGLLIFFGLLIIFKGRQSLYSGY